MVININIKNLSELIQDDIDACVDAQLYGTIDDDDYVIGRLTELLHQIVVDRIKEYEQQAGN